MRQIAQKIKPKKGFAHVFHFTFSALIPLLVYIFVRIDVVQVAVAIVVLSKWRVLSVRPRFWAANLRANSVDLLIGLGTIVFLTNTTSVGLQIALSVAYLMWQLLLKPSSNVVAVAMQALIGQAYGLSALFIGWGDAEIFSLVISAWFICYLSARHFFTSYDEPYTPLYSYFWGYFAAALVWLSSHWLIFYSVVAQPALLISAISFGLGSLYYLNETDKLSSAYRREIVIMMSLLTLIVLLASDWGDKAI